MPEQTWVPFQPTAQTIRSLATGGQSRRRRVVVLVDSHRHRDFPEGRAWWGYAERQASEDATAPGIVGDLYPVAVDSHIRVNRNGAPKFFKGWTAPWYPPPHYISNTLDLTDGLHFAPDYKGMATDWELASRDYYQRAVSAAVSHQLPIPAQGGRVDFRVQAIVGRPPMSPRIPRAALTGHEWLLGFSTEVDETLHRLLDIDADNEAIRKAAEEMERAGAKVQAPDARVATLEQQLAAMQKQLTEMTMVMQERVAAGDEVEVVNTPKPRRGRPPKAHAQEAGSMAP